MTSQRRKALLATIGLLAIVVALGLAVYWLLFPILSKQWQLWLTAIAGAIVAAVGLIRGLFAIWGTNLQQLLSHETLPPSPPPISTPLDLPPTVADAPTHQTDIAKVRQLLLAAFTPEDLRRFCQDRPTFRPVLNRFGPGYGHDDMVDELITYSDQFLLQPELLAELKKHNPRQYARFFEPDQAPDGQLPTSTGQEATTIRPTPQESTISQAPTTPRTNRKIPPEERDEIRAERNRALIETLEGVDGILKCSVLQLEDHTDSGYLLHVRFDVRVTHAAEVLSIIRRTINDLFPDIPYWGELLTESDDSVGFGYTYIDEHNKLFR